MSSSKGRLFSLGRNELNVVSKKEVPSGHIDILNVTCHVRSYVSNNECMEPLKLMADILQTAFPNVFSWTGWKRPYRNPNFTEAANS